MVSSLSTATVATLLIVVAVVGLVAGALIVKSDNISLDLSGLTGILGALQGQTAVTTVVTTVISGQVVTSVVTPAAGRAPTMLTVTVTPNPMNMHGFFIGTVTSDGQNYGITITYTTPRSESLSIRAFLGPNGMYTSTPIQMNIPGEYRFSVRADNGVISNTAALQVNGVYINVDPDSVSRAFFHTITVEVSTGMYRSNYVVTASRDGWATSTVIVTGRVDTHGYASWTGDFNPFTLGNYEFDVTINGQTARSYGASDWVNAQR